MDRTSVSKYRFGRDTKVWVVHVDDLLYHLPLEMPIGSLHQHGVLKASFRRGTDDGVERLGTESAEALIFTDEWGAVGVLLPETWDGPKILVGWGREQMAWCRTLDQARDFLSRTATFDVSFEEGDRPADSDERLLDEMERRIQLRSDKDSLLGS